MDVFARRTLLSCLFLCALAAPAPAQDASEEMIYEASTARCGVTVMSNGRWATLQVRVSRFEDSQTCALSREETITILSRVFEQVSQRKDQAYQSVVLGLVEDYEWLQRHLVDSAAVDDNWLRQESRPRAGGSANAYVEQTLARPQILWELNRAAGIAGYTFEGFSCEKIRISGDGLPMDGMCGLGLVKSAP